MTKREDNHAKLELHIYNTAIELFCDRGYSDVTLNDIAEESGVSSRTLYRYYPTKDSILFKFCRENMMALKEYARTLDQDAPLKDRILDIMVHDFQQMFCMFDPSYILHCGRDNKNGVFNRFEMENVFELQSVYAVAFKHEQLRCGIGPNNQAIICASVVCALYRHCNDVFRFRFTNLNNMETLRLFYEQHLNLVWDSLYAALLSGEFPSLIGESGVFPAPKVKEPNLRGSSARER